MFQSKPTSFDLPKYENVGFDWLKWQVVWAHCYGTPFFSWWWRLKRRINTVLLKKMKATPKYCREPHDMIFIHRKKEKKKGGRFMSNQRDTICCPPRRAKWYNAGWIINQSGVLKLIIVNSSTPIFKGANRCNKRPKK